MKSKFLFPVFIALATMVLASCSNSNRENTDPNCSENTETPTDTTSVETDTVGVQSL